MSAMSILRNFYLASKDFPIVGLKQYMNICGHYFVFYLCYLLFYEIDKVITNISDCNKSNNIYFGTYVLSLIIAQKFTSFSAYTCLSNYTLR